MAEANSKWHGGIKETVPVPTSTAWAIYGDFGGLGKWVKTIDQCDIVEGENRKPGCVRYLVGNTFPRPDGAKSWAKEKLHSWDEASHSMSYQMIEGNFELVGYISHFKLQDVGDGKTLVDWSFEADPIANRTEEQVASYMTAGYQTSLKAMQEFVRTGGSL